MIWCFQFTWLYDTDNEFINVNLVRAETTGWAATKRNRTEKWTITCISKLVLICISVCCRCCLQMAQSVSARILVQFGCPIPKSRETTFIRKLRMTRKVRLCIKPNTEQCFLGLLINVMLHWPEEWLNITLTDTLSNSSSMFYLCVQIRLQGMKLRLRKGVGKLQVHLEIASVPLGQHTNTYPLPLFSPLRLQTPSPIRQESSITS